MSKAPEPGIVAKLLDEARTHQRYSSAIVDPRAETWCEAAAIIKELVEALIDWRNTYLCPCSDIEESATRLLTATDAALSRAGVTR